MQREKENCSEPPHPSFSPHSAAFSGLSRASRSNEREMRCVTDLEGRGGPVKQGQLCGEDVQKRRGPFVVANKKGFL